MGGSEHWQNYMGCVKAELAEGCGSGVKGMSRSGAAGEMRTKWRSISRAVGVVVFLESLQFPSPKRLRKLISGTLILPIHPFSCKS